MITRTNPIENERLPKQVFADLLPYFLEELLDEYSTFQQEFESKNSANCRLVLHKISGASKTYGAFNLANIIDEVKSNISEEEFLADDLTLLSTEISNIFKYAKSEFGVMIS